MNVVSKRPRHQRVVHVSPHSGTPCDGIMMARDDVDLLTMPMDDMRDLIAPRKSAARSSA